MELDKRIIEGKTYLDCFDAEVAKGFIGKECYLSDGVASFANVDNLNKAVLIEVDDENIKPYTLENIRWRYSSNFILPCEWVKEHESPEFVPYTLDTWGQDFKPGDVVFFRGKEDTPKENNYYKCMYLGYLENENNRILVILGPWLFTFFELFELYEIYRNGNWEPFGVIDE